MDGSKKLFTITCMSKSEKDCPQSTPVLPATPIPEPSTLLLMSLGLVMSFIYYK
jgi:hypothetical protein